MGTISKNFSYSEFEKSDIADRRGYCNTIRTVEVRDSIKALTDMCLQPLRDELGVPGDINSGYRCPELNEDPAVGGSPTSQHPKGEAADVAFRGKTPIEVATTAVRIRIPFDQMILYPTFVHFSHKLHGKQRGQILYSKTYKGPKLP